VPTLQDTRSSLAGFGLSPLQTQVAIARYGGDEGGESKGSDDGKESKGEDDGGGRPVRRPPLVVQLPKALEGGKLDLHAVLTHGDRVPRVILDLLLQAMLESQESVRVASKGGWMFTLESVRVASKGGWIFVERYLRTALVDTLLSPETTCGKLYKKWLQSSPTMGENAYVYPEVVTSLGYIRGAPATCAEMLALYRGLQKKAVLVNLVNELQVEDVDADGIPVNVDAPLKEWEGVMIGADGQVVEIDFSWRCKGGA
jgi:hypothetical protein